MGKTVGEVFVKDCSVVGGIHTVIQNPQRPVQKLQEPKRHFLGKSIAWLPCPRELIQPINYDQYFTFNDMEASPNTRILKFTRVVLTVFTELFKLESKEI